MERIVILGSSGAGKSTLAKELSDVLEFEVFHLDRFFWSGERLEKTSGIGKLRDIVQKSHWIIDGNYLRLSEELHLDKADTIIFLDMPPWLCFWSVLQRHRKHYKNSPDDIPKGYASKLSLLRLLKILTFPLHGRRKIKQKLWEHNSKQIVWLRSRKEVKAFLARQSMRSGGIKTSV